MRRDLFPVTSRRAPQLGTQSWDPFAMLQTEMNRMLDEFGRGFSWPANESGWSVMAPRVDVSEDGDNIYVTAELPGLSEKDVEVTFDDGVLRIAGEKTQSREDQDRNVYISERTYGRFHRELPIQRPIHEDKVDASFSNGVLTITLPKAVETRNHRKIEVKRAA